VAHRHALRRLAARIAAGEVDPLDVTIDDWFETEPTTAAEREFLSLFPSCTCCLEYTLDVPLTTWQAELRAVAVELTSSDPLPPGC
jgi:hypothetical protein